MIRYPFRYLDFSRTYGKTEKEDYILLKKMIHLSYSKNIVAPPRTSTFSSFWKLRKGRDFREKKLVTGKTEISTAW